MAEGGKAPDLGKMIREWVLKHFGVRSGIVIFVIGYAIFWMFTHWDAVSKWPGVTTVFSHFTRWQVPKADPNLFSILVAHLENDPNRDQERLIVEALKEFKGMQVLVLDRTIPLVGPVPEDQEKRGHEIARQYLEESGAAVLIWGTMLGRGDKSLPKLYWTTSDTGAWKARRYDAPTVESQYRLPEVFWADIAEILRLLVVSHDAEFRTAEGRYVADRLPPFIARVRALLEASTGRPNWDDDSRAATRLALAYALSVLAEQSGKKEPLEEAVSACREALKEFTQMRTPLQWAMTQNNLGNALKQLGEWESGTARLEEALSTYREALKEFTQERTPLPWAATLHNLGNALATLGERESGTARLEEALSAYREALKEYTQERRPLRWASTQKNLGATLAILGERESGTVRLEEAVSACREALKEGTRERVPLDWAMTQLTLGSALEKLGERESGTARLEEALSAYREALKEGTRERGPLGWAMTQNNLGNALATLGERESGTARLEEALLAYQEALKEYTRERLPLRWAMTQNNLGCALERLGERESGTARLEEAVFAFKAALEAYEAAAQASYYIEVTKANIHHVETLLYERMKTKPGPPRTLLNTRQTKLS